MKALIVALDEALMDRMVSVVQAEGLDASGTTSILRAVEELESGTVGGLVIGDGVQESSQQLLSTAAADQGIAVIGGAAAGKDPQAYARQELVPQLRRVLQ